MKGEKIIENICQSLDCSKHLTQYELDRQRTMPRALKYRFCRSCRQYPSNSKRAVRWRCRLCPEVLCDSNTERGKYYCSRCGPIEGKRRSKKAFYSKIGIKQ